MALLNSQQAIRGTPPKALQGFEHVTRIWDNTRCCWVGKILPGEFYVSQSDELISTVLGSCVAACIIDMQKGVGGMNHFMLPESATGDGKSWGGDVNASATRFGVHAMEHLINSILANGGRREHLEVKLFGGGRILASMTDIGKSNINFAEQYLRTEKLKLISKDVGEIYPRRVIYDPRQGKAWVKRLRAMHNNTIIERDQSYQHDIENKPVSGEIELF